MYKKVKLILNPMADMGQAWRVANDLRPIVAGHGGVDWSGTVYPTHAVELARQAAVNGYDLVIAMGGDGTVHEVVNGLMQVPAGVRPALGVVPLGSGNDFAHAIGVPVQADKALAHALNSPSSAVDIGLMIGENGRKEYFDNSLGVGFDAVVTIRSHKLPVLRGFIMYLAAVVQTILLNYDAASLNIDNNGATLQEKSLMFAICNGPREGGGFLLAPEAKVDDASFEFVMVKKCGRLKMLRLLPEFIKGTHARFPEVITGNSRKCTIQSDRPLYVHTDGEVFTSFGSNLKEISVEILPAALQVVRG